MIQEQQTYLVKVSSRNKQIKKILSRIEKLIIFQFWIGKADAFWNRYLKTLDDLSASNNPEERGIIIERCEALMISFVNLFLRCFLDQPDMKLQIQQITNDQSLKNCYAEIKKLRDDEHVHWKGLRSRFDVFHSMKLINQKTVEFAATQHIEFQDGFGFSESLPIKKLISTTMDYLKKQHENCVLVLNKNLSQAENFMQTSFVEKTSGKSVFKMTPLVK